MANSYFGGTAGAFCKMSLGLTGSTLTHMDFIEFKPQIVKMYSDGSVRAMRGSLDRNAIAVAEGPLHVRFRTAFWLTAAKLDILLLSLGFTVSTDTWTLADAIPQSTMIFTPGSLADNTFTGMIPTDVVFYGQKGGQPNAVDIGWIGSDWTQQANGTYTHLTLLEGYPYAFGVTPNTGYAASFALGSPYSNTLGLPQARVSIDYKTVVEFNNSAVATYIQPTDHEVTVSTSAIYEAGTNNLITLPLGAPSSAVPDVTGASFTWNMNNQAGGSNNQSQIVVAKVMPMARFPRIVKHDLARLPLNFLGFASGGTASVVITNIAAGV